MSFGLPLARSLLDLTSDSLTSSVSEVSVLVDRASVDVSPFSVFSSSAEMILDSLRVHRSRTIV